METQRHYSAAEKSAFDLYHMLTRFMALYPIQNDKTREILKHLISSPTGMSRDEEAVAIQFMAQLDYLEGNT